MGLLMNIALGIVGVAIASAIFSFFGIALGGWIGRRLSVHERSNAVAIAPFKVAVLRIAV